MRKFKFIGGAVASLLLLCPAAHASSTVTYTYDARGRLKTVTLSGGTHSGAHIQ